MPAPSSQPQHHHETSLKDRVSLREKIGLGLGRMVFDGTNGTLQVLLNPVFNWTMGLNPAVISTIVFIQRLWNATLDPLVGQYSDNFRSKWGRRRPLMLIGILPVVVLFAALWLFPRGASDTYLTWNLLLVSLAFYVALSLFSTPLNGLIIEATDDYHERTRLVGVTLAFGFFVQIGSQWLFLLAQTAMFRDKISGIRWVGAGCGVFFLVAGVASVLLCRERLYAKVTVKQARVPFWASLRAVRDNRSFMAVLMARCVFNFGYNIVGVLPGFMNTYYVLAGNLKMGAAFTAITGSAYHVASILTSLYMYPRIERRIGKKRTLYVACWILVFESAIKYFFYLPGHPWLPVGVTMLNGVSCAGVSLMTMAMLGDIADFDEYKTGLRREGLFVALLSWFDKAGNSFGSLLTGFILVGIGFNAKFGAQSHDTMVLMKFTYMFFPAVGALCALFFVRRYQLTQDQIYEIKDELTRRRTDLANTPEPGSGSR